MSCKMRQVYGMGVVRCRSKPQTAPPCAPPRAPHPWLAATLSLSLKLLDHHPSGGIEKLMLHAISSNQGGLFRHLSVGPCVRANLPRDPPSLGLLATEDSVQRRRLEFAQPLWFSTHKPEARSRNNISRFQVMELKALDECINSTVTI